ncbi:MAG: hypothetical protein JWQ80_1909 [Massilia sp.]|nr:hypothetical protein [Massilia sp.]
MNKHSRFLSHGVRLATLALALAVAAAGNASAADATAASTGTVVAPIAIAKIADLAFGSFAAGSTGGSVTVSPNGTRAVGGGVVGMSGATTAAQFDVTGQAGSAYSITLDGTATLISGSNSMTFTPVSALTASAITSGAVNSGTLTGGAQSIFVGGVLTVAANQAAGVYGGTVTATVEYN